MIAIVDHAYEAERNLARNLEKVRKALAAGEKVIIHHPKGFIHGRLANIPGVRYIESRILPTRRPCRPAMLSGPDMDLFRRLTSPQQSVHPYHGMASGDLFIHWFYAKRAEDRLSLCEVFHINMLRLFDVPNRVERIHIRCATQDAVLTDAMKKAIDALSSGKATVDFRMVPPKESWEHDTIKEAAEYAAETGSYTYYIHFKGASRLSETNIARSGRENVNPLNVLYWAYIMYEGLFSCPSGTYDAIGPIACNRINKEYLLKDLSWSTRPEYQYIGSFQAFDGKALSNAFRRLGLDRDRRERLLWWGGRYTVEMFLCLIFLETEVHAIAQMENESTAYAMYTGNFCPGMKRRFAALYSDEDPDGARQGKGVAICAVAKDEDPYLEEWANHHLSLGVSHIYLYDNNDVETEAVRKIAGMANVTVIPLHGGNALKAIGNQAGLYTEAYRMFGGQYEWMGFLDLDEFVTVDCGNIEAFLASSIYDGVSVVHLNWRYHGDNGLARYDSRPVQTRFKEPSPIDVKYSDPDNMENRYVKSFVRTGIPDMKMDIHSPRFFGALCRNAAGRFQYASRTLMDIEHRFARVEHYGTRTIEEYIRRRIPNGKMSPNGATGDAKLIPARTRLDWFFRVNEMTEEKLQVIHELLPDLPYPAP